MDYDFETNFLDEPIAKFSMGHEAIGRWLSEELSTNALLLEEVLSSIAQIENNTMSKKKFIGQDFDLLIDLNEAIIQAHSLAYDYQDELPDNTALFDQELIADCGLPDFKQALISWQEFLLKG